MKNSRIVRAYDSINPSIEEKQRMLDAILQEASLEEKPTRERKKREPVVHTAKPTKVSRRSTIMTIAASIVMLLFSGLVLAHMIGGSDQNPSYVEPTEEQGNVTVNVSYVPVLEKYRTAIREGWSKEECEIEGISTRFYMPEPVDFTIGKRILDINNDGRAELLIGHDTNIWDLYTTLEDGTPVQLLSDVQDGWQYYLNKSGLIAAEYFSKEDCYAEYYRLEDHQLVMELQLKYRDGQWMQQKSGQEWEMIIADSAESTMNSFEKYIPDWIPLQDHAQTDADALERYSPILEKYKTALAENWTWEQCQENDISHHIFSDTTNQNNLGWCIMDLDNNGISELIVSDGVHLFDLYTLVDDLSKQETMVRYETSMDYILPIADGVCHLLKSDYEWSYTLCKNGIIQLQEIIDRGTAWCFYGITDSGLEIKEILRYRNVYADADKGYQHGPNSGDMHSISKDEAGKILSYYQPMDLSLNPLAKPFYPDAELYYRPLRELYQRALDEHWDPPTCMENGMSLMVAHRGEYYDQLGYTIKDLDRNGVSELIITDGTNIYDLYTLIQDEEVAPLHLVSAMERLKYYLTEDDLIYFFGSGSASSNYQTIHRLADRELVLVEGYFFDGKTDPDHPWYLYDGENIGVSCGDLDVQGILDSYKTAEIPFTPFE